MFPRSSPVASLVAAVLGAALACGPGQPGADDDDVGSGAGDGDTQGSSSSSATTGTEESDGSGSDDAQEQTAEGTFLPTDGCYDGCDEAFHCDLIEQDCPEGDKCVPEAGPISFGWDGSICVAVQGQNQIGEACESSGINGPSDDCDGDSFCWTLEPPTEGGFTGTCVPFCQGDGQCDEGYACDGFGTELAYCVPTCEPLLQDCAEGQGCYFIDEAFVCAETTPPADDGSCSGPSDCFGGQLCISHEFLLACPGDACCAGFCDLGLGDEPCQMIDPAYACVPFYEEGESPPALVDLGVCVLAQP